MAFFDFIKEKTRALALQAPVVHPSPVADPYEGFYVEYFPHSRQYYPMYKGECLRRTSDISGRIDRAYSGHMHAEWFKTERGAWKFIDEMILQNKHGTSVKLTRHPHRR